MLCYSNGTSNYTQDYEEMSDDSTDNFGLFVADFEESVESTTDYSLGDPRSNDFPESFDSRNSSVPIKSSSISVILQGQLSRVLKLFISFWWYIVLINMKSLTIL